MNEVAGSTGGMILTGEDVSPGAKPVPVLLCPPQIPLSHELSCG